MNFRQPLWKMAIVLTGINLSLFFLAIFLGVLPDDTAARRAGRLALCEELSLHAAHCIQGDRLDIFTATLDGVANRNPDIVYVRLVRADGTVLLACGRQDAGVASRTEEGVQSVVQISINSQLWGTVQILFQPEKPSGLLGLLAHPLIRVTGFVGPLSFVILLLYLRRFGTVMQAGPGGLVPRRVRTTINTLTEGMVILDKSATIVITNEAFGRLVGCPHRKLEGRRIRDLAWSADTESTGDPHAWIGSVLSGKACKGVPLSLVDGKGQAQLLSVNASPIWSDDGQVRGIVATFEDQTMIQKKNARMKKLLRQLQQSRTEVQKQNEQLRTLATRDPLTGCLNRRAFYQQLEFHWSASQRGPLPLACVLVDVDHFKAVNDTHGHGVGDQVLQRVAAVLQAETRKSDVVCRYGGEEFCLLLPGTDLGVAVAVADRIRRTLAASMCGPVAVTASFGVALAGANGTSELLDCADKALYAAKRRGRNRVVTWEELEELERVHAPERKQAPSSVIQDIPHIPFQAVSALVSALAYRHGDTAEHSWRVSDLCVSAASGLLSPRESYILEIGALLHDIGKLGVPDAVLLKPGPLTPEEWTIIRTHEGIGQEIIRSAFHCPELTALIALHHAWYAGPEDHGLPVGEGIPLGARLLSIADAYDAMISNRVYRKGRTRAEAFAELRRCAGTQFDPVLVERFIATVQSRDDSRASSSAVMSKQTALQVGLQVERLTHALDAGDLSSVATMARHIREAASTSGADAIVLAADRLLASAEARNTSLEMTQRTLELLDACRVTYQSYLLRAE